MIPSVYMIEKNTPDTPNILKKPDTHLEKPLSPEQELIILLNTNGVEDENTKAKLIAFATQCELEAGFKIKDNPDEFGNANAAQFIVALTMAKLYSQTEKYKDYALESLYELQQGADTVNERLQKDVAGLIEKLEQELK